MAVCLFLFVVPAETMLIERLLYIAEDLGLRAVGG
jgi:hypothetical protein